MAFSPDGSRAYVAERLSGTIAVLDAGSGKLIARVDSGGKEPTGLALSESGDTILVANSFSDTLGLIDATKNELRARVPLRGGPWSVACRGGRAYVSLSRVDRVVEIDPHTGNQVAAVAVGRRPRALAVSPDGRSLLCANMTGGSLSLLSTDSFKETARIPLNAVNLRGIAIRPDGARAYITGQVPHNDRPTSDPEAMWLDVVVVARLDGKPSVDRRIPLDLPSAGAADPTGIALAGDALYVTLAGAHQVTMVHPSSQSIDTVSKRFGVEANPVSIAMRPGGELWCANALGNSITVLSGESAPPRTIRLDPPDRPDIRLRGRFLFTSAQNTKGGGFTCNTCHPDGSTEGVVWKFAHTKDGLDVRNSRGLRGAILLTGPYGWTGRENDLEAFIADEIHGLLRGPAFRHGDLHGFWDLVNQMELPPNPYRQSDGSFTESAKRGRAVFTGEGGCSTCHTGPQSGGTKHLEWIGTTPAGIKLDVPHLQGAYDSAPYLHDGSASTLEDVFQKRNAAQKHGKAHLLTEPQMRDVLEYVREL
jgi:YVTN family beta-propeller protein